MRKLRMLLPVKVASAALAFACAAGHGQSPAGQAQSPASNGPAQAAGAASLNDALLAKATTLYDSAAKTGLRGFDCRLHPDWKKVMSSARGGAAVADDDPKLVLVEGAKITLHARLSGGSSVDWQMPEAKQLSAEQTAMLERARRGMEQTLLNTLKLWTPLVDGSIAEPLGEDDVELTQTENGYRLRSKDRLHGFTEEFDRNLLLKHYITVDGGSTVDIEPVFEQTGAGPDTALKLTGFVAHMQPAGESGSAQDLRFGVDYQSISGTQIPARITIDLPNVVEMDFALDGCTVNSASK